MEEKVIEFEFKCSCGHEFTGGFYSKNDMQDRLHCDCGLIWEVNRPYIEIE